MAIDWGRRTSSLPNLSNGEIEGRDQTEPWFLGLTSEVPTFSFWFISFLSVITYVQFAHVVLFIFSSARPLTVYKYFFLSRVQKKKRNQHRIKPWECLKQQQNKQNWTNVSILKRRRKKNATRGFTEWSFFFKNALLSELWDWTVLSSFCLTFFTLCQCWFNGLSEAVCFMLIIYFFLYRKRKWTKKKT